MAATNLGAQCPSSKNVVFWHTKMCNWIFSIVPSSPLTHIVPGLFSISRLSVVSPSTPSKKVRRLSVRHVRGSQDQRPNSRSECRPESTQGRQIRPNRTLAFCWIHCQENDVTIEHQPPQAVCDVSIRARQGHFGSEEHLHARVYTFFSSKNHVLNMFALYVGGCGTGTGFRRGIVGLCAEPDRFLKKRVLTIVCTQTQCTR